MHFDKKNGIYLKNGGHYNLTAVFLCFVTI